MQIRVWKLGSLEHMIIPTKESIEKFKETLSEVIKNGGGDIVWGPELSVEIVEVEDNSPPALT